MKSFADFGIHVNPEISGRNYISCPQCSKFRKKKSAKCLGVNVDSGSWFCYHCGWSGNLKTGEHKSGNPVAWKKKIYNEPDLASMEELTDEIIKWFAGRGICLETLMKSHIKCAKMWLPQVESWRSCIAFPYFKNDRIVNIKYRDLEKHMIQVPGAEKIIYRHDQVRGQDEIVITEGEIDTLSFVEAGINNVCSVPNGARDLGFLKDVEEFFVSARKIILAVDKDQEGSQLETELSRRIGRGKCYVINYPEDCKDVNDVLIKYGKSYLDDIYKNAKPYPVKGIFQVSDFESGIDKLYDEGRENTFSTGWGCLYEYYTIQLGQVTVVTGIPSHGKSEFVDALMMNLLREPGWSFAVFSPENYPLEEHFIKLAEKVSGKPFFAGVNERMNRIDLQNAKECIGRGIKFILPQEDLSLDNILELARVSVYRYGVNGIVLDPWNEIDHSRPQGLTETEYISQSLTRIRNFARIHDVHFWIIAHPTKLEKVNGGKYPVPTPYDISGSAHWRNKADNCIAVWRNLEKNDGEVEVHIQKIRFKNVGKIGIIYLYWDRISGCFVEPKLKYDFNG